MSNSAFRSAYNLAFQVSPIILTGGAFSFPVPIIALIGQLGAFVQGLATSGKISESDFYATFLPVPGGTVINNSVAIHIRKISHTLQKSVGDSRRQTSARRK